MKTKFAIVSDDGLSAKVENQFKKIVNGDTVLNEWKDFDKANPPIPLTTPQEPGERIEVESEPVWQGRTCINGEPISDWFNLTYNSDALSPKEWEMQGYNIRQAIQPITKALQPITKTGEVESKIVIESLMVSLYDVELAIYEYWSNLEDEQPNYHDIITILKTLNHEQKR